MNKSKLTMLMVIIFLTGLLGPIPGDRNNVQAASTCASTATASFHTYLPIVVTAQIAPNNFGKVYPSNGAVGANYQSQDLSWASVQNAESYDYCVDTSNDNACTGWTSTGANTQVTLTNLDRNTTYYWQVRANNTVGTTYANWHTDAFWSFTTGDENTIWIQQTESASWVARDSHVAEVLSDDSIILISGLDGNRPEDVWRSTDFGATWTLQTNAPGWSGRSGHNSVTLSDDSILIMGGKTGFSSYVNDVWRSTDMGVTWTQMTDSAGWSRRSEFGCTALSDDSILVLGGLIDGSVYSKYVYRSTDMGATWSVMNNAPPWGIRAGHVVVTLSDDSIVLMGGKDSGYNKLNDVWRSTDMGATWTLMTADASWPGRWNHTAVVLSDDSILLMGGEDDDENLLNDVWLSTDMGASWTQIMTHAQWSARDAHATVAMSDDSIVLMGGKNWQRWHDVWRLLSID